jgi:ADP-ribose pyrophosphatase YjhB (NUDIX family)
MDTGLGKALQRFDKELPHFPDGRIDYSDAGSALALGIIVFSGDKFLLVKRSQEVGFYPCKWNWVSGFIDEQKPLRDFAEQELYEETGISSQYFRKVFFASPVTVTDDALGKTWFMYPAVVALASEVVPELDWEAQDHAWVTPAQLSSYETVPGVTDSIRAALAEYRAG